MLKRYLQISRVNWKDVERKNYERKTNLSSAISYSSQCLRSMERYPVQKFSSSEDALPNFDSLLMRNARRYMFEPGVNFCLNEKN